MPKREVEEVVADAKPKGKKAAASNEFEEAATAKAGKGAKKPVEVKKTALLKLAEDLVEHVGMTSEIEEIKEQGVTTSGQSKNHVFLTLKGGKETAKEFLFRYNATTETKFDTLFMELLPSDEDKPFDSESYVFVIYK